MNADKSGADVKAMRSRQLGLFLLSTVAITWDRNKLGTSGGRLEPVSLHYSAAAQDGDSQCAERAKEAPQSQPPLLPVPHPRLPL